MQKLLHGELPFVDPTLFCTKKTPVPGEVNLIKTATIRNKVKEE